MFHKCPLNQCKNVLKMYKDCTNWSYRGVKYRYIFIFYIGNFSRKSRLITLVTQISYSSHLYITLCTPPRDLFDVRQLKKPDYRYIKRSTFRSRQNELIYLHVGIIPTRTIYDGGGVKKSFVISLSARIFIRRLSSSLIYLKTT